MLRLALPSNVRMEEETLSFLRSCGLEVRRPSSRQYTASIPQLPGSQVLFQRAADIPAKVEEGSVDLAVVGLDRFRESEAERGDAVVLIDDLGYSHCELLLAVPEAWLDVTSVADLADLAAEMREAGRQLRVATGYPRLVQRFLVEQGINFYTLVESAGATESAPMMGYADVIADIAETRTTLRDNHLKVVAGGTILESCACLVGNRRELAASEEKLTATRHLLELVEAHLRAGDFYKVTANIQGASEEAVAEYVRRRPEAAGRQGPTVSRVYPKDDSDSWYAVTVVVPLNELLGAVEHLRAIGGSSITVVSANYVFDRRSEAYTRLERELASVAEGR